MSQRSCRIVKIYWIIGHFRQICNVADSSKFIGLFLTNLRRLRFVNLLVIFDQSATLQIRQNLLIIFDQNSLVIFLPICDVADSSKFIGHFSTNLRRRCTLLLQRCRFIKIYWSFSTNLRCRRFVKFIGRFRPICNVADSSKFIGHFLPIHDVAAMSQIRRNLCIILD